MFGLFKSRPSEPAPERTIKGKWVYRYQHKCGSWENKPVDPCPVCGDVLKARAWKKVVARYCEVKYKLVSPGSLLDGMWFTKDGYWEFKE